jgi:hypothetical protein
MAFAFLCATSVFSVSSVVKVGVRVTPLPAMG